MKSILFGSCLLVLCVLGSRAFDADVMPKCYICSDVEDKVGCGSGADLDPHFLLPCNSTDSRAKNFNPELGPGRKWTMCRKMVTQVDFDVNTNKAGIRVKRTCGWDDQDEKYVNNCYYRGGLGGRINVCSCNDKEGCNGSSFMAASLALLVPTFILAFWKVIC